MNLDNIAPAGSINSNIDDMLKWVEMWTNKGIYNGSQLLSENSFRTITTEKIILSNTSDEGYAFGWNVGFDNGKKVFAHGGGLPGYKSFITIIPDDKTGVIILTNKLTYLNEELTDVVIRYLNSKKINWEEAESNLYGKNFHFPWEENDTDTSYKQVSVIPNFAVYKGLYDDKEYGKANIKEENGKAILELLPSKKQFSGYLYYISPNKFKIVFNDRFVPTGYVEFKLDRNKKPTGFKLDIDSGDFLFKYLDFKKE